MGAPPLPPLAEFLRWLGAMPAAFRGDPQGFPGGRVRVRAVVADVLETLLRERLSEEALKAFAKQETSPLERNRLRWILAACFLLWHPSFRGKGKRESLLKLLGQELASLAAVAGADKLRDEEERREELVRRVLGALELRLPGESARDAADRMAQVDSVERHRVMMEASERERRARQKREAELRRRAEEEAASKATRE